MEPKAFRYKDDCFVCASWWDEYYIILTLVRDKYAVSRVISSRVFEEDRDVKCSRMIKQLDAYEKGEADVADVFAH